MKNPFKKFAEACKRIRLRKPPKSIVEKINKQVEAESKPVIKLSTKTVLGDFVVGRGSKLIEVPVLVSKTASIQEIVAAARELAGVELYVQSTDLEGQGKKLAYFLEKDPVPHTFKKGRKKIPAVIYQVGIYVQ